MNKRKVYIKNAAQISMQQPLSENWMSEPVMHDAPYVRSVEPVFRDWLDPLEARRMGKILKRALVTAMKVMADSGIEQPDAVVTGTGLGCIENTEVFLNQLCKDGEEMLKPTCFMQSTHNTISSLISIKKKCYGYNSTYSHKSISFDSALLDAFVQMRLGDINTALVTGNDEMTPSYYNILQRAGYVGQAGQVPAGEASAAFMLTTDSCGVLCEIEEVKIIYGLEALAENIQSVDAILTGVNGDQKNDGVYREILDKLPEAPLVRYKHIFGECYTASALGMYAAAHLLDKGEIPAFMTEGNENLTDVRRLLVVNHSDGKDISMIILQKVE